MNCTWDSHGPSVLRVFDSVSPTQSTDWGVIDRKKKCRPSGRNSGQPTCALDAAVSGATAEVATPPPDATL
jgi:hypothetical protein